MIHLADTAEQVRFFASCDLDTVVARYQNVVDCCICGVRFLEAETRGESYRISVEVRTRLTLDTGKKIRNRYEEIRLELEGRQDVVTQHSRALREYKCPNCGGSVDILGGGVCEYCNTAVDYRNFGWIITSYTNLGQPENPFAKILAGALGSYLLILFLSLVLMAHSEDGKDTFEILQSVRMSTEYLKAVQQDIIYPDAVISDCTENFCFNKGVLLWGPGCSKRSLQNCTAGKGISGDAAVPGGIFCLFAGGSVRICRGFGRRNVLSCDPHRKCIGRNCGNCDTGG